MCFGIGKLMSCAYIFWQKSNGSFWHCLDAVVLPEFLWREQTRSFHQTLEESLIYYWLVAYLCELPALPTNYVAGFTVKNRVCYYQ